MCTLYKGLKRTHFIGTFIRLCLQKASSCKRLKTLPMQAIQKLPQLCQGWSYFPEKHIVWFPGDKRSKPFIVFTSRLSDFKDLFSSNARQRFDAAKSLIWDQNIKCLSNIIDHMSLIWDRRSKYKISFQYYWSHVFDMRWSKYLCKFIVCPFFDIQY